MMKNPYKVLIISCWSLLIFFTIFKPMFANQLLAGTDNQTFIKFSEAVDNSFWYYILAYVINFTTCGLYYMAVLQEKKPSLSSLYWAIPLAIYIVLKLIFKDQRTILIITDIALMIGLPIVINPKKWLRTLLGFVLVALFQFLSRFLKLRGDEFFDTHFFIASILSIDYYIMLVLYWLYSTRKEVK